MNVDRAMYRFRFLNGANLMAMNLSFLLADETQKNLTVNSLDFIVPTGTWLDFFHIASDGGYLNQPHKAINIWLAPAERVEILIDFSRLPDSDEYREIYLTNNFLVPTNGYGIPLETNLGVFAKFVVPPNSKRYITPTVPSNLNHIPGISTARVSKTRWIPLVQMADVNDEVYHLLGLHTFGYNATEVVKEVRCFILFTLGKF